MAGRAFRMDANDKRILIAIGDDADHCLRIAGGFSLVPEALTAAAEENGFLQFQGFGQAFTAHVGDGQDFSRRCVLHNCGDQSGRCPT